MENGIKSPSLSCGSRSGRATQGLKQAQGTTPMLCDVLAKGFQGRLEHLGRSPEGNGVLLADPELS